MGGSNDESSITNQVAYSTVYLRLVLRVVRDLTLVLQVASETKQDNTLDLVPHVGVQLLDRVIDDGTSLTIYRKHFVSMLSHRL